MSSRRMRRERFVRHHTFGPMPALACAGHMTLLRYRVPCAAVCSDRCGGVSGCCDLELDRPSRARDVDISPTEMSLRSIKESQSFGLLSTARPIDVRW